MSFRSTFVVSSRFQPLQLRTYPRSHPITRKLFGKTHLGHLDALDSELTLLSAKFASATTTSSLRSFGPLHTGGPNSNSEGPGELSDQEWEIRTGRAIYILQQTLPTFFTTGLVSSLDTATGPNSRGTEEDDVSIYSPNIRLEYRPPTPFPPPFPTTLHVEGLPLYLASSTFIRHTLNALYTDLRVELQRVRVYGPRSSSRPRPGSESDPQSPDGSPRSQQRTTRSIREKSLFIGLTVRGTNRVSKAEGGWEVNSTYTFSPLTGLIHIHNIDSIHPAPHQAFFSALQAALSKLGLGGSQGAAGAGGIARNSPSTQTPLSSVANQS